MAKRELYLTLTDRLDLASTVLEILGRGNTAQIKLRKDDIIILEERRKIKRSKPVPEAQTNKTV